MIADLLDERIAIDPEIAHGRPVIKGTRVPVEIILGALAGGMETGEVASEYGLGERTCWRRSDMRPKPFLQKGI